MALTTVRPQGMGFNTGRRNLIINGAMQVAQRGTSSTTNGYASLDRYQNSHSGGTVTQTQESLTSGDPYDDGHRNFLRSTNTSAGSAAATDNLQIQQIIESQDLASSGWDSTSTNSFITLSAWLRSSLGGTYYVRFYIYDGNKNYTSQITLSADTWKQVTITIPGASGNTINNDNGQGMFIAFVPYIGTNNTASDFTLNQWATFATGSQAPDYAQNWRSTSSATFDITGVQLELGENASDFEHRSIGEELALCQRYHQRFTGVTNGRVGFGTKTSATGARCIIPFNTAMRTTPSHSITGTPRFETGAAAQNVSSINTSGANTLVGGFDVVTASGGAQNDPGVLDMGDGGYIFDAEL